MNSYTRCILQNVFFILQLKQSNSSYLPFVCLLNRGSYMHIHVLLMNITNEFGKEIKWEDCQTFYLFFASLINSIIQE